MNLMRKAAVTYARRGWHVLPLFGLTPNGCACGRDVCGSPGKHPQYHLAPNGLKNSTTDEATIDRWFSIDPSINIGIRTGAVSGIVVVDLDVDHGGFESFADLDDRYGRHEPTVLAITGGGGLHYYFRHPGGEVRNSASSLGPGIDVRGDGGFVVAPPSIHHTGAIYQWDGEGHPAYRTPSPLPDWVQTRTYQPTAPRTSIRREVTLPGDVPPISEGGRNMTLASYAGKLRFQGADEETIRTELLRINAHACNPPLPEREVVRIASSIARYPAGMETRV